MRWKGCIWAVVFAGIACTEPKVEKTYTITFQNTETFSYGGTGCVGNPNTLYCGTWKGDSYTFVGTMRGDPATALVINGAEFTRYDPALSSLTFRGSAVSTGCHSFTLSGQQGDDFSGTFSEATDCHAGGRKGTFQAHRSDPPE